MRNLTTTLLLILIMAVFAQAQQPEKPALNVIGSAQVNVKPDLGILDISVSELKLKMSDAIIALGEKSNYYKDLFIKLGFNEKDIKTTNFTVSQNRFYRNDKQIDSGYRALQNIRLEFVYSQKILQKIVEEFSKSEQPSAFSFDFELSEELKQKVQSQIIEYAVKDANERATVMAKAAKVKLVSIKQITYGSSGRYSGMESLDRRNSYVLSQSVSDDKFSLNFTPNDLTFSDSVKIEWIIE